MWQSFLYSIESWTFNFFGKRIENNQMTNEVFGKRKTISWFFLLFMYFFFFLVFECSINKRSQNKWMCLCSDKRKLFLRLTELINIFLEACIIKKGSNGVVYIFQLSKELSYVRCCCFPIWNSHVKVPCLLFKTFLICILFKLTDAFLVEKWQCTDLFYNVIMTLKSLCLH